MVGQETNHHHGCYGFNASATLVNIVMISNKRGINMSCEIDFDLTTEQYEAMKKRASGLGVSFDELVWISRMLKCNVTGKKKELQKLLNTAGSRVRELFYKPTDDKVEVLKP